MFGGMRLYSRFYIPVAGAPDGANCEAGDFHANLAFSFLDNTQRSITIYTRARVSLLSSCSLKHWPSIIAGKPAMETQFLRLPGLEGLMRLIFQILVGLPIEQLTPMKPSVHWQMAVEPSSIQVAPFRHGLMLSWHADTADRKKGYTIRPQ